MKRRIQILAASLMVGGVACAAERIVHIDEMDHLAQRTLALNEGAGPTEERCGVTAGGFATDKKADFNRGYFKFVESPQEAKWTVFFKFCFPGEEREFGFKLYFGDPAKPETRTLFVREAGSYFEGERMPSAPKEGDFGFACGTGEAFFGAWQTGAIAVEGGSATFWVPRGGKLVADAKGRFPDKPLIGWNITATAEKTNMRFDRVILVDGAVRRCERGDFQEVIDETLGAPRPAWDASFGAAMAANAPVKVDFARDALVVRFRSAFAPKGKTVDFELCLPDGQTADRVSFGVGDVSGAVCCRVFKDGKFSPAVEDQTATNGMLVVSGSGTQSRQHFVPPFGHMEAYETAEMIAIAARRDRFARPADVFHELKIMSDGLPNVYRLLLNGQVFRRVKTTAPISSIVLVNASDAEARFRIEASSCKGPEKWVLDLPKDGFKLERVRENLGSYALECSEYLSRDALKWMPSSCLWNVPRKQWYRARALCRIDPTAPGGSVPVATARLTHFAPCGGRSLAMAQTTIDLSKVDPRVVKKGDGLYEVTFDLDVASIMDLTSMVDGLTHVELPFLHFEFTGPLWEKNRYYVDSGKSPAQDVRSNVIVLEGELMESPVMFTVKSDRPYALYYPGETPKAEVVAKAVAAGKYSLAVKSIDEDGKVVRDESYALDPSFARTISFPNDTGFGHYKVRYSVTDDQGAVIQQYEASYGLLPENTREAKYDSPFYSWNFGGNHGTVAKFEDWAKAYDYLGVKKSTFDLSDNAHDAETNDNLKAHSFTLVEFPYISVGKDDESKEAAKKRMRSLVARFPHCKSALVFHESGGGPFPKEAYGETMTMTKELEEKQAYWVDRAVRTAKAWREVDSSVKLIIGNSGESYGLVAYLMRGGFPKELADSWGDESVGLTMPPEMSTAFVPWVHRHLAKIFGYPDRVDAPYEFKDHTERYERSNRGAAAVRARDHLICLALGDKTVPVEAGCEIANSYADTIWCSGTFTRWPLALPRENALQTATLTLLLDRAKFKRQVETGSLSAYALEFEGKRGEWIYALWTMRGETTAKINGKIGRYTHVRMMGRRTESDAESVAIGDEPCYLVTTRRIHGFSVEPKRTFKYEEPAANAANVTVVKLTSAEAVDKVDGEDVRIDPKFEDGPMRPGGFGISSVTDEEKGECIEIEHLSQEKCPEIMQEYVFMKIRDPKPIEKPFHTIGVWAKGNSNWGRVSFEITDAEGEKWYSSGIGGVGTPVYDWPAKLAFNYDGWNFLQAPLTAESPVRIVGPGENHWMWTRDCTGNGKIDWPVKVTGLGVTQWGRTLDLLEMKKGSPKIRLCNIEVR